ncbi:MAG: GreA/GreB family elongation factor [Verrucomicrobia bacterium]|nr:GreA/GreB family elongation factor [Verrucomicrobiota bacterium]
MYTEEFRSQLAARDSSKLLQLWHEYCQGDIVDGQEIIDILQLIKQSDFITVFGQYVEAALPLALLIEDPKIKLEALRLIIDIQTTNSEALYHTTMETLKNLFSSDPAFLEKIRLVSMRSRENFQGAISNFLLLNHIKKNNFVLHTAGWGVGEIIDFSILREQISIEFENVQGHKKEISFKNAFKTLIPIPNTHFLARRFGCPDLLEKDTKENPVEVVRSLLSDLGPKTAAEIKDILVDLVIPEEEYSKWWQQARGKIKKDALIDSPENPKLPFSLRKGQVSLEERIEKAFSGKKSLSDVLQAANSLIRDFPEVLKVEASKETLSSKIKGFLATPNIPQADLLQALLFLDQLLGVTDQQEMLKTIISELTNIDKVLEQIEILSLKKRLLIAIRTLRSDWASIFWHLLFVIEPNQLRDYILKELVDLESTETVISKLRQLLEHPKNYPEALFWYFQKVLNGDEKYFQDLDSKGLFFEALLILFSHLDYKPESRDLLKKIYALLTGSRFEVVRALFKAAPVDFVSEFLLLSSKCQGFSTHDQKILKSLAEVAHPQLAKEGKNQHSQDTHTLWTTAESYAKTHERIKKIGTVDMVENAKEIETARAHGDLRENAEYKSALERRSRLQSELRMLSDQFRHARIITKEDIKTDCVGVGTTVGILTPKGDVNEYTILGLWDANPEASILSVQSKFVQAMLGKQAGESFSFKDEEYKVAHIKSFLEE